MSTISRPLGQRPPSGVFRDVSSSPRSRGDLALSTVLVMSLCCLRPQGVVAPSEGLGRVLPTPRP